MNLNQVTISSTDLEKSVAFYQTLGLQIIVKALPHYARFVCPVGESTFSIHLVEELLNTGATIIYFEVDDVDAKVQELEQKSISFISQPVDQSWLWREARLQDPDGNLIIIYHAGENRINPPWKV